MRQLIFILVIPLLTFTLAGCFGKAALSPKLLKKIGEGYLKKKEHAKARETFEKGYNHKKATESEKKWFFYRLGVTAEISGNRDDAIFHYSGDNGDDHFYDSEEKLKHWVKFGLHSILVKKRFRSYRAILKLEASNLKFIKRSKKKKKKSRRKRRRRFKARTRKIPGYLKLEKDTQVAIKPPRKAQKSNILGIKF